MKTKEINNKNGIDSMKKYFILLILAFAGFTANAQEYFTTRGLLYATDHSDRGFYATTVGQPEGEHHKIGAIPVSYQAMEMVNGILYVVTYDETDGNTFGVYDYKTGVFTQIAKGGDVPNAISMAWNPLDNEVYVTQWSDDASGSFGTINLTTGAFTALGTVPGNFCITIDNDGVCYGMGDKGLDNPSVFGAINLTNGDFTQIATREPMYWIQDMSVDRRTNEIYHIYRAIVVGLPSPNTFRKMNKTNGDYNTMGTFDKQVESFVIFDQCPVKTFPWTEGFESPKIPTCWTVDRPEWPGWWFVTKSDFREPYGAHGGNYKAYTTGSGGYTEKLITPSIDLSGLSNPVLNFWHAQKQQWNGQDFLKVYYRTSSAGTWNLLAEYTDNVPDWTERTMLLPNASADYYIAFEATLNGGGGVHLDDVKIYDSNYSFVDVEIVGIISPVSKPEFTNSEKVTVLVRNNGTHQLSGFELKLELDGVEMATEPFTGFLPDGDTKEYTFTAKLNLSTKDRYEIKVTIIAAGDEVKENDSQTVTVTLTEKDSDFVIVSFGVVGGNGTLAATVDSKAILSGASVEKGRNVVFIAVPNQGYRIKEWKFNGAATGNSSNSYMFKNLTGALNVTVEFDNTTGSDELPSANPLRAQVIEGLLRVSGIIAGEPVSIYNVTGALMYYSIATSEEMDIPLNSQGVYIVRSGDNTVRVSFN